MSEAAIFKTNINLTEYAASFGYVLDKYHSSKNSILMSKDDKIVIARNRGNNHWIYFSVTDDKDNGSIIDFHQNRTSDNFGYIMHALRRWNGSPRTVEPELFIKDVQPSNLAAQGIIAAYYLTRPLIYSSYLDRRGIPKDVINHPYFADRIRIDDRKNIIFPHKNRDGICGFEIKNYQFTGFSKGGTKGLWLSRKIERAKEIIFTESAIDALSYHVLHPDMQARYASVGGAWASSTQELIKLTIEDFKGERIRAVFDNDEAGQKMASQLEAIAKDSGKEFINDLPEKQKDWNDVLTAKQTVLSI